MNSLYNKNAWMNVHPSVFVIFDQACNKAIQPQSDCPTLTTSFELKSRKNTIEFICLIAVRRKKFCLTKRKREWMEGEL